MAAKKAAKKKAKKGPKGKKKGKPAKKAKKGPAKKAKKGPAKKAKKAPKAPAEFKPDLSFVPGWAERLGKDPGEIEEEYDAWVDKLTVKHGTSWPIGKIHTIARRRLYASYKDKMGRRGGGTAWIGKIYYIDSPFDWGNGLYKGQLDKYEQDPHAAVANGDVKVEKRGGRVVKVIPLDPRKKFRSGFDNKKFGEPLPEHAWIMNAFGVAMPLADFEKGNFDAVRPFNLTASGNAADPDHDDFVAPQVGIILKWRAFNKTKKDNEDSWTMGTPYAFSEFLVEYDDGAGNKTTDVTDYLIDIEDFDDEGNLIVDDEGNPILKRVMHDEEIPIVFEEFYSNLGDLEEYHSAFVSIDGKITESRESCYRVVIVEGDVIDIVRSTDDDQSDRIYLDDETLGFGEEFQEDDDGQVSVKDSVACFLNDGVPIAFGKYSHILAFATTSKTLKKDESGNVLAGEWNSVGLSVKSIIVLDYVEPDELEDDEATDADGPEPSGTIIPEGAPEITEVAGATVDTPSEEGDMF